MNNVITATNSADVGRAPGRLSTAFATAPDAAQTAGIPGPQLPAPVFLVVGFDGTEPAERALDSAARLLHDRDGALEVVYVAHVPAGAAVSADALVEARYGFDDLENR